jgi:hypothetical protein
MAFRRQLRPMEARLCPAIGIEPRDALHDRRLSHGTKCRDEPPLVARDRRPSQHYRRGSSEWYGDDLGHHLHGERRRRSRRRPQPACRHHRRSGGDEPSNQRKLPHRRDRSFRRSPTQRLLHAGHRNALRRTRLRFPRRPLRRLQAKPDRVLQGPKGWRRPSPAANRFHANAQKSLLSLSVSVTLT